MVILSQNKQAAVFDYDTVVCKTNEEWSYILAQTASLKEDETGLILGKYVSEERCQEVLMEIVKAKMSNNRLFAMPEE